ncbi:MAG: glycosyltransferase [Coriobacteriia bacterium]|nr:glycosyltransferase [Coriobacteriia bacterium]
MHSQVSSVAQNQADRIRSECAIGVVTYNPDIPRLVQVLESSARQAESLIVVDNGSANVAEVEVILGAFPGAVLLKNVDNLGLARALNRIAATAFIGGKWLVLLLDQDSIPSEAMLQTLYPYMHEDVGIVCPVVVDRNEEPRERLVSGDMAANRAITSGSLLNLAAWSSVGGYDERLFVDWVDFEFCDNLRLHGYRLTRVFAATLLHELGRKELAMRIFRRDRQSGLEKRAYYRTNHEGVRLRDKARSQLITIRKYWKHREIRNEEIVIFLKGVALAILLERRKVMVIRSIASGVWDGASAVATDSPSALRSEQ